MLYSVLKFVISYAVRKGQVFTQHTSTLFDDLLINMLKSIKNYFLFFISIYISLSFVEFSGPLRANVNKLIMIIFFIQLGQLSGLVIDFWIEKYLKKHNFESNEKAATLRFLTIGLKTIAFSIIFLLALNNIGIDVTALIAGLGVGGIAVALALQNILTDLFSSLTIVLDKPFVIGDFIVVNEFQGTVEFIGIKTTRLRSLSGEQLIFGNGDLLQSRIRNYKRMEERRVVQSLTVTYQTPTEMLKKIPSVVKDIINSQSSVRFDRCHFLKFLDSSLEFELVYWVESAEFNDYAEKAHNINIEIFDSFNQLKIDFAYPTQTLNISTSNLLEEG